MRVLWISAVVVGLDQFTKAAVLHFMVRQQSIPILGDWLKFTFTENPGMAFGIQLGTRGLVTFLSMAATLLVIYYMYQVRNAYTPYRASLSLILGGALGNIIDRVFYGVLLGYDGLFFGKVVDFIHVSLWEGFVPQFVPFLGGRWVEMFPIWNVADMAIVLGVVGVLYFQNTFHQQLYEEQLAQMEGDAPEARAVDGEAVVDVEAGDSANPETEGADDDGSTSPLTSLPPGERSTLRGPGSEGA